MLQSSINLRKASVPVSVIHPRGINGSFVAVRVGRNCVLLTAAMWADSRVVIFPCESWVTSSQYVICGGDIDKYSFDITVGEGRTRLFSILIAAQKLRLSLLIRLAMSSVISRFLLHTGTPKWFSNFLPSMSTPPILRV